MPTLAEEEASEESDYEEESEDVFNELVDRLRKVALEAQVCQVHYANITSCYSHVHQFELFVTIGFKRRIR